MALRQWERQPGEPDKAFFAFTLYRDLGAERSLSKAYALFLEKYKPEGTTQAQAGPPDATPPPATQDRPEKKRSKLGRFAIWSAKYQWVERCRLYDIDCDRKLRQANKLATVQMKMRHADAAQVIQGVALKELKKIVDNPARMAELKLTELVVIFREAVKIERLSRGEAEDITETKSETKTTTETITTQKREFTLTIKSIMDKLPTEDVLALERMLDRQKAMPIAIAGPSSGEPSQQDAGDRNGSAETGGSGPDLESSGGGTDGRPGGPGGT